MARLVAILACLMLAACATSSLTLSKSELAGIRIEEVRVAYKPDAAVLWPKVEQAYVERTQAAAPKGARSKVRPVGFSDTGTLEQGSDDHARIMATPEAREHMRKALADLIKSRVASSISPRFGGSRAVRLEIEVHAFVIPHAMQRVALGGTPLLLAITSLKDARTGAELGKLDRGAAGMAGNGVLGVLVDQAFSDLEDRVLDAYISNVLAWLQAS
jgi:hypothetical protein